MALRMAHRMIFDFFVVFFCNFGSIDTQHDMNSKILPQNLFKLKGEAAETASETFYSEFIEHTRQRRSSSNWSISHRNAMSWPFLLTI